jgi:hypothetical protein
MYNQSPQVLDHWQKPGDIANNQQFSAGYNNSALTAFINYHLSNAIVSNASYIRLKNLALSYSLPAKWFGHWITSSPSIYIQGQNLFTITNYNGADPETQNFLVLPPLRILTIGIHCTL